MIRKTGKNATTQNLSIGLASQTTGSSNPGEPSDSSAAAPVTSRLDYSGIAQSGQQRPQAIPAPQVPPKGPPSFPPEVRAKLMAMPENERNKWLMTMHHRQLQQRQNRVADAKGTMNSEAPFQSGQQSGPAGVPVSQAKAPVANPTTSQPPMNPTAAFNVQS